MATTHFHTGSTHLIRQTPLLVQTSLPWRGPTNSTPPRSFNPIFRPLLIKPLKCAAKPQDPNPIRAADGFMDILLDAVNDLIIPGSDTRIEGPVRVLVDHMVDNMVDALKNESVTQSRYSDPVRAKELTNPISNPKPDWVMRNPPSKPKSGPEQIQNDDILDTIAKTVEELKNRQLNPNPNEDTRPEYSNRVRVGHIPKAVKESHSDSNRVDDITDALLKAVDALKNPEIAVELMRLMGRLLTSDPSSSQETYFEEMACIVAFLMMVNMTGQCFFSGLKKTTVVKLQVGLLGSARSLQRDLNEIAETANTSTPQGLSHVLTESAVALLRHSDYYISASSFVGVETTVEEAEKLLNKLCIEERGKFDEETLVNVNNLRRKRRTSLRSDGFSNEYIVMTILVAAEGEHKLPTIDGVNDLKDALRELGSIPCSRIAAVEVMWTPQDENDVLSMKELVEDYPHLKPLF